MRQSTTGGSTSWPPSRYSASPGRFASSSRSRAAFDHKSRCAAVVEWPAMKANRSIPASTVIPVLIYPDVRAAVEWLSAAFGFVERVRIGEDHRAQLSFGEGAVVVGDVRGERGPPRPGEVTHSVMVRVDDATAHYERARAQGARIVHGADRFRIRRASVHGRGSGWPPVDVLRDARRCRPRGLGRDFRHI